MAAVGGSLDGVPRVAPVLGIPVINRPDLLEACLASIDADVRLVVIDNSGTGDLGDVAAESRPDALIAEPATNLGYTASVNHIIRSFPHEPFWIVSNADVVFAPGDLQRLIDEPGGWVGIGDWRVFKLTAETVERVGFWDDAGFFTYCSDADYERRCDLAGIDRHFIEGATSHVGSVAIKEARFGAHNRHSYPEEVRYHHTKWGVSVREQGGYSTPFNQGGHLGDFRADLSALRRVSWNRDGGPR
jgi:GT2 family glycosyltransferase